MVSGKESTFLGMKSTLSDGNLNKRTFCISEFFRCSLVLISPKGSNDYSFFGSSLVFYPREIGKVQRKRILTKVLFEL